MATYRFANAAPPATITAWKGQIRPILDPLLVGFICEVHGAVFDGVIVRRWYPSGVAADAKGREIFDVSCDLLQARALRKFIHGCLLGIWKDSGGRQLGTRLGCNRCRGGLAGVEDVGDNGWLKSDAFGGPLNRVGGRNWRCCSDWLIRRGGGECYGNAYTLRHHVRRALLGFRHYEGWIS